MPIRRILVLVASGPNVEEFIGRAFAIAADHKAHVTVVNARGASPPYLPADGFGFALSADLVAEFVRKAEDEVKASNHALRHQFDIAARHSRIAVQEGPMPAAATASFVESNAQRQQAWTYARLCDLVIAPRPAGSATLEHAVVQAVLFDAKHPALLLPPKSLHAERGAAIAWNGSQEAAAALERTVDLLDPRAPVQLIQVGEIRTAGIPATEAVTYLRCHRIKAEVQFVPDLPGRTAEILLQTVKANGAGLLVAGAYSHSRVREAILGGVTANLLAKAHLPVLMAR